MEQYRILGSTASDIAWSIEREVQDGALEPGEELPSVRKLAESLDVSPGTVAAAYRHLRDRGVLTTRDRSRTLVSHRPPISARAVIPVPGHVRDLTSGNPDPALLPSLDQARRRVDVGARLYGEPSGYGPLLDLVAPAFENAGVPAAQLAVVSGALDGLERLLGAHLRPGDRVAVEDPCFTGVLDLVRAMGLTPVAVPVDELGPRPQALEAALAAGSTACVVTPRAQNPTGAALDEERASALRDVLARFPQVLVVEDDHAGWISDLPHLSVIRGQRHWAVIKSLNKSHGPDLRLAVLSGDGFTVSRVQGRQLVGCGWVSHVLQRLAADLLTDPAVAELTARARRTYDERREGLVAALREHGIAADARSGFNVWIPVGEEEPVTRGLLHFGWAVRGGEPFRLESGPAIRVTTATLEPDAARRFVSDLVRVLRPEVRTHVP